MKRYLILLSLTLLTVSQVSAQIDIALDSLTGANVWGDTLSVSFDSPATSGHLFDFHISNSTGADQSLIIHRTIIAQPDDWSNYLCWGYCYSPSPIIVWKSNAVTVPIGTASVLNTYVNAPNAGTAHYRYYVSDDGVNLLDSVDVVVNSSAVTAISEVDAHAVSIFPNPAKETIQLRTGNGQLHLAVFDLAGSNVLSTKLNAPTEQVDVSLLQNGCFVYVVTGLAHGQSLVGKLVIAR